MSERCRWGSVRRTVMARRPPSGTSRGSRISVITSVVQGGGGCWFRVSGVRVHRGAAVLASPAVAAMAAGPAPGVRRVLAGDPRLAQVERLEGVDHDGRLLELLGAEGRLDR